MEAVYDMWREELAKVDKTLEDVVESLEKGDEGGAYKAVYNVLVWWSKKRNKYDIKEINDIDKIKKFLDDVAKGHHPISQEYILPKTTMSDFVNKMLAFIKEKSS